jgi:inositol phosphorylceramide synthase catalytic subunit
LGLRTDDTPASRVRQWPAVSSSFDAAAGSLAERRFVNGARSLAYTPAAGESGEASSVVVPALACLVPFGLVVLGYEAIRLVPRSSSVHIAELVTLEARFFSVVTEAGPRTLSDIIASNTHPLLDLWCGATYLSWVLGVLVAAAYLFTRHRRRAFELSLGFLVVNLAGWAIWLSYPAAPPWYVDLYGTGPALLHAPSSAAGLARFDALLGWPLTSSLYSKSAYVFGAMPSLHVAYATLVAWASFPVGGKLRVAGLAFVASMAFSAVYLRHHYVIDVVAGVALAVPVALLVRSLARRWSSLLSRVHI